MNKNDTVKIEDLDEKNTKKVDGKYVFIPEGYMSVIIPINDKSSQLLPSLNPDSISNNIFVPNSNSDNITNLEYSKNSFIGPGKDNDIKDGQETSELITQQNASQLQSVVSNLMDIKNTNESGELNQECNNQIKNEKDSEKIKEKKVKKIPRPKNSFLFYLKDKTPDFLKINPNINRREVSKAVGKMWRNETEEVKKIYAEKARIELEEHKLKYPNYKFTPDRSKKNKKLSEENKKSKEMKKKLGHQRTSSDDLSVIQSKLSRKQTRQRSISNSVYQTKKLEEMYNENKVEYDQELENNHELYQTLINSVQPSSSSNPNINLNINNNNIMNIDPAMPNSNNNSFSSLDDNSSSLYYDSSSFIDTDISSSYFDELSLSSYNNSASNLVNPLNNYSDTTYLNEILNATGQINPNPNINIVDPNLVSIPFDTNPNEVNQLMINNSFPIDLQAQFTAQSNGNDIKMNNIHSPCFDEIFAPVLDNENNNININPLNITNNNNYNNLSNTLNSIYSDITNTAVPIPSQSNVILEPQPLINTDTTMKNRRLSEIQQKNNLRIITSAEDLNELANPINSFGDSLSSATTTNTDIINSADYSKYPDSVGSNNSNTPSYLASKMQLMENFNALNLSNSYKYKSPIHAYPHSYNKHRSHHHNQNNIQCNSASVVPDKSSFPFDFPLSAGQWNPDNSFNNSTNGFDFANINGLKINPATASIPTNSGPNSATSNASSINSFGFNNLTLESRSNSHDNLENHSSNSSIHSTNKTSSSIKKKTKPINIKFSHKKNSSLSKLNSSNSILSVSESYNSSSTSSSSLQLNPEDFNSLNISDPYSIDIIPTSTTNYTKTQQK